MAENLESVPDLQEGQQVIMPIDQPIKETGHIQVQSLLECAALPLFTLTLAQRDVVQHPDHRRCS